MIGKCLQAASLAASYAALLLRWPLRSEAAAEAAPRRILVLGYAAIGDLIFLLPTLRLLRKAFPQACVTFLADRYAGTKELLPASNLVDDIWLYEHAELGRSRCRREIFRRIRSARFDAVVVSHGTPMRAFAQPILNIPLRTGHCRPLSAPHAGWSRLRYALWRLKRGVISGEFERRLALNLKIWLAEGREHAVRRNLRLIEALGGSHDAQEALAVRPALPELDSDHAFAERTLASHAGRRIVGLHLGAAGSAGDPYRKIWSAEQWARVCEKMIRSHPCVLVILGGPSEVEALGRFRSIFTGPCVDLVGRASLLQTLATIRRCEFFLGCDTGPVKAAMALGVPTFSVWGPSSRRDNGAFWDPQRHREVQMELPCQPCIQLALSSEGAGVINSRNC
ncbi:MAG: glycosyltransferase family 9 protein [Elusimicrobiota bacterium]